jgi:hypothetical protein
MIVHLVETRARGLAESMTTPINSEHAEVAMCQSMRAGQNRYRTHVACYFDCACIHQIGSMVYCPAHGVNERVINSAISVWNPMACAYSLVFAHEEIGQ